MDIRIPMGKMEKGYLLTDEPNWIDRAKTTRHMDQANNNGYTCMTTCSFDKGYVAAIYNYSPTKLPCIMHISPASVYGIPHAQYVLDWWYVDPSKRNHSMGQILFWRTIKMLQAMSVGVDAGCKVLVPVYSECSNYVKHICEKYGGKMLPNAINGCVYYMFE